MWHTCPFPEAEEGSLVTQRPGKTQQAFLTQWLLISWSQVFHLLLNTKPTESVGISFHKGGHCITSWTWTLQILLMHRYRSTLSVWSGLTVLQVQIPRKWGMSSVTYEYQTDLRAIQKQWDVQDHLHNNGVSTSNVDKKHLCQVQRIPSGMLSQDSVKVWLDIWRTVRTSSYTGQSWSIHASWGDLMFGDLRQVGCPMTVLGHSWKLVLSGPSLIWLQRDRTIAG